VFAFGAAPDKSYRAPALSIRLEREPTFISLLLRDQCRPCFPHEVHQQQEVERKARSRLRPPEHRECKEPRVAVMAIIHHAESWRKVAAPDTTKAIDAKNHRRPTILIPTSPRSAVPPSRAVVYGISLRAERRQGTNNPWR
jgi:hypothetical protein